MMISEKTCMKCGKDTLKVVDTRPVQSYEWLVRRRRKCRSCGYRFSTYELQAKDIKSIAYNMYYCELRDKITGTMEKIIKDVTVDKIEADEAQGERIIREFGS